MKGKRDTADTADVASGEPDDVATHSKTDRCLTVKNSGKRKVLQEVLFAVLAIVPPLLITGLLWVPILVVALMGFMEDLMLYLVPPVAVPIWIWLFRRRLRKWKPRRPELISLGVRCALVATLCAGILVAGLLSFGSAQERMMARVLPRIKRDADIAAIRAWTESYCNSVDIDAQVEEYGSPDILIPRAKLPKCVSVLNPLFVSYDADTKCLRLDFCSRLQHWDLVVATEDSPLYKDSGPHRQLEPGAWIWAGQRE